MKKLLKAVAAIGMSSVMMLGILQICDAPQGRMVPGDSISTYGEIIVFPLTGITK